MLPWVTLASARTPDGADITLRRRGEEFVVRVAGHDLMSSRQHGSEDAMARLACEPLRQRPAARVLVGGLGLGYTLRATLDALPADASVVVAELVPALVDWNRDVLAPLAGRPLDDARVQVEVGDITRLIRRENERFDAILLDVDNGPSALTSPGNAWLYREPGLRALQALIRPGGTLVVWSAGPDAAFERRLKAAGFRAESVDVPAHAGARGTRHVLFVGRR